MLIAWFFVYKKLAQFALRCALPPRRSESPVCATVNKPSCVLHLLGWFIGSHSFSSLERRPEFWVLQSNKILNNARDSGNIWPGGYNAHAYRQEGINKSIASCRRKSVVGGIVQKLEVSFKARLFPCCLFLYALCNS